ncbi:TlpA family protein disulfide reductase [Sphingobacterium faecale]|uniref:AhpC/TSA family protein n=1 Tax=Sphingobacterium faecale TaxID=2803775 RepID=A0ABS1RBT9_9SPHI|nr:TlpA disulfide reductase family protein [Sphingobacterium faecale]MBL1411487.1 AhpC/TSA family protein [Sphingobacterium faecale]
MKKINLTLLLIIASISIYAQKHNSITGTAPEKYNGSYVYLSKIYLHNPLAIKNYIDSVHIIDGKFIFNNDLSSTDTVLYAITLNNNTNLIASDDKPVKATYIEGSSSGYFQISGSLVNNSLNTIMTYPRQLIENRAALVKKKAELSAKNEWTLEDEEITKEKDKKELLDFEENVRTFVKDHTSNPAGLYIYILHDHLFRGDLKNEIESKLSEDEKQKVVIAKESITEMLRPIKNSTAIKKLLKTGDKYIDFESEMLSGDKAKLSTIISSKKLTLLDFWASWCGPCLNDMPEMVNLQKKHKNKGFQIVGISLDTDSDKWKNTVERLGMQWVQFIDSNPSNPIAESYEISSIPHTVLINEDGDIVAIGLRGNELKNKIEELLSKH